MNKYINELFLGEPIYYHTLVFYPLTISQLINITSLETFQSCMLPFILTKEFLIEQKKISKDNIENFNVFEDYILKENILLEQMAFILGIFCKVSNISLSDKHIDIYDNTGKIIFQITKNNFDDISDILCSLTCTSKIKVELPPENMSQRQKDIWEKLQAGRKREAKKNETHIHDIMNICSFCGNYYIPISEIKQMTLWQLMNCYKSKITVKIYDDNLAIGIAAHDLKSISNNNHWTKKLLIRD